MMDHNDMPHCQAVNKWFCKYYNISVMIKKKWQSGAWQIHSDNAWVYLAQLVQQFVFTQNITQMPQPVYSPHMGPSEF